MRSRPSLDERKAAAFRLHVIESCLPLHILGTTSALVCAVVSKMKNDDFMALFDVLPWSDFREVFAVVSFILMSATQHVRVFYVKHFELACDLINWLGMLARLSITRYNTTMPWALLRPIPVVAAAIGERYEFRKQWKHHAARLFLSSAISVRLKREIQFGEDANPALRHKTLTEVIFSEALLFFLCLPLCLGTQLWLETVDAKNFEIKWAEAQRGLRRAVRTDVRRTTVRDRVGAVLDQDEYAPIDESAGGHAD